MYQGALVVGGTFLNAGSNPAVNFARWVCDIIPGDITGDGIVDVNDLLAVIAAWGPCPTPPAPCPADIAPPPDGDGVVDVNDLLLVIANWS